MAEKFIELRSKSSQDDPAQPQPSQRPGCPSLRPAARRVLAAVYDQVGLPPVTRPDALPAGERRMLNERKLTDFVDQLYQPAPATTPKPSAKPSTRRAKPS